jgi:hypothetical protein
MQYLNDFDFLILIKLLGTCGLALIEIEPLTEVVLRCEEHRHQKV